MPPNILAQDEGDVRLITMNRPRARNAMNRALAAELHSVLVQTASEGAVRTVIVTGAGTTFSAGLDVKELSHDGAELLRLVTSSDTNPFRALRELPQPVIAAVNGPAVTGGLELVLACDLVVASTSATFVDTHARVGVMPAQGMAPLLSSAVGASLAKWMSLSGRPLSASAAHSAGLVGAVVEPEQLLGEARRLATEVSSAHPATLRSIKNLYKEGLEGTRRDWIELEQSMFHAAAQSAHASNLPKVAP